MQKIRNIEDKVTFIICFRASTEDRKKALQFVLNWLNKELPNLEILIIEQDTSPKLSISLSPNCKRIFIYNSGLFNRSWAFNVALNHTNKEILAFSDADAVLTKKDYLACFEACNEFDAVTPNARMAINIDNINLDNLDFKVVGERYISFASMLLMVTRNGLETIGGWDERFEGWGYEDIVLGHLILNRLKAKSFNHTIFHVDHKRTILDGDTQPQYFFNKKLFQEICMFSGHSLNRYCTLRQEQEKGNPNRYALNKKDKNKIQVKPIFVLGLLTLNPLNIIKKFIDNWLQYRTEEANWKLVIIDDGSDEKALHYLDNLSIKQTDITIIKNNNKGIGHSINSFFKKLTSLSFDLAFVCQPSIYFKQSRWENLYWERIKQTDLGLLVYQSESTIEKETTSKIGFYASMGKVDKLRPYFFTITSKVITEIGYMDSQYLGFSYLVFQEYFLRCCRNGFNFLHQPLDVDGSNDFIGLNKMAPFNYNAKTKTFLTRLAPFLKERHSNLFNLNRTYLAWNEIDLTIEDYQKVMVGQFPKLQSEDLQ